MAITAGITGLGGSLSSVAQTYLTFSIGGAFTAGRYLFVTFCLQDSTVTISSFTDDTTGGPMTFSLVCDLTFNGLRHQAWQTTTAGVKGGGSYLKANLSGSTLAAGTLSEWAGVQAVGSCVTGTGTGANPSVAVTTQDTNNYVVGGFSSVGSTLPTSGTGTLDRAITSGGGSPVTSALTNNTSASAASVTNSVTLAATTWIAVGLELRSVAPSGGTRQNLGLLGIGS